MANNTLSLNLPNIPGVDHNNLDELKDSMVRGIYVLEAALFSQASFEYSRIESMRTLLSDLEKDLFSPAVMANLTPEKKAHLYNTVSRNMNNSLNFLHRLHSSVADGLDAVNAMERLRVVADKSAKANLSPDEQVSVDIVKRAILERIKDKSVSISAPSVDPGPATDV